MGRVINKVTEVATGNPVNLPRLFAAREGLRIEVEYKIIGWDKSHQAELLTAQKPIGDGKFFLDRYHYVLAFEDINGHLFDQEGRMRNRKEIDLRWTLPNSLRGVEHGITLAFVKHKLQIYKSRMLFTVKKAMLLVGLWR